MEETEIDGLAADQQTHFCANVTGSRILQVQSKVSQPTYNNYVQYMNCIYSSVCVHCILIYPLQIFCTCKLYYLHRYTC